MVISFNTADESEWNAVKVKMMSKYEVNDMGQVHYILGIKVTRNNDQLVLSTHTSNKS